MKSNVSRNLVVAFPSRKVLLCIIALRYCKLFGGPWIEQLSRADSSLDNACFRENPVTMSLQSKGSKNGVTIVPVEICTKKQFEPADSEIQRNSVDVPNYQLEANRNQHC